jgi:hypothetical protein
MHLLKYNPEAVTTTSAATPAQRLLAKYLNHCPSDEASQQWLSRKRTDLLAWAGRDGRYNLVDLEAILEGHGETLSAWGDACNEAAHFQSVYDAEALLTWLGY